MVITRADVVRLPVRVRAKRAGSVSIALVVDGVTFWRDVTADASKGEVVNTTFTLVAPNGPPVSGGLRLKRGGERLGVLVGYGANPSLARANPSVRYTLLAQAGPTLEVMEPGTTWRPDENIQDRLVWRRSAQFRTQGGGSCGRLTTSAMTAAATRATAIHPNSGWLRGRARASEVAALRATNHTKRG